MTEQIRYQSDYRPGWTYLQGQHKPDELTEATNAADKAWDAYYDHVEKMIIYSKTGDEESIDKMNELRRLAVEADAHKEQIYQKVNGVK